MPMPAPEPIEVEQYLADCYGESHGLRPGGHRQKFAEQLGARPLLRQAAQTRLETLSDAVCDRDYLSRYYRDLLQQLLNSPP